MCIILNEITMKHFMNFKTGCFIYYIKFEYQAQNCSFFRRYKPIMKEVRKKFFLLNVYKKKKKNAF